MPPWSPSRALLRQLAALAPLFAWLLIGPCCIAAASASFPQDVFARPAFQLQLGPLYDSNNLPIRNSTAITIMQQQQQQRHAADLDDRAHALDTDAFAVAVTGGHAAHPSSPQDRAATAQPPLTWLLHRSSVDTAHLCAVSDFTTPQPSAPSSALDALDNVTSSLPRQALVARALHLLEPLKRICLFHTIDWFTYSFCHGKDVRQFRALTPASAADRAHKGAGGGAEGKKAAVKAAAEVAKLRTPVADPAYDAFTLGRWKPENDRIVDPDNRRSGRAQGTATSTQAASKTSKGSISTAIGIPTGTGTELIEVVQFGDWDEEELHAEEMQIHSRLASASSSPAASASTGASLNRQRYITQTWSDGTLCNINNQPRSIEIQFHCGNSKGLGDQIVAVKETTICNYVVIVETSRLCNEPAFRGPRDDSMHPVRCHKIVRDDWAGTALEDARDAGREAQSDGAWSTHGTLQGEGVDRRGGAAAESSQSAPQSSGSAATSAPDPLHPSETTVDHIDDPGSHTYGDLSQYSSVHDDFYDEALGGEGYLEEELLDGEEPEVAYRDRYDLDEFDGGYADEEMFFQIALDEDGKLLVDVLTEEEAVEERARSYVDADEALRDESHGADAVPGDDHEASKSGSRRSRRRRPDNDIQLDLTDILDGSGVLNAVGNDAEAQRLIAKTIEDKLSQAHKRSARRQHADEAAGSADGGATSQTTLVPGESAEAFQDLYQELLDALRDDPLNRPDQAKGGEDEDADAGAFDAGSTGSDPVQEAARRAGAAGRGRSADEETQQPVNFPRNGRMKKVGDSLGERAKRFYEAEHRKREKAKEGAVPAAGKVEP
ncbi:uncharacterized protein PFL1_03753 [Pseudozyma flocculosa PF-1]|uniref:Protein OS-9 homolog n=2 Tax=Pseudozyma flocculosa TaxID=84751 RepID=A0A5C3EVU5_9BASI|nr:uncharacterized protein PFL1_03753 [Pseudozyma flocculosa PF-1]EPQ28450.1 hypothetical protein PFL1_03753 [Pseudozyma flocculosa PF-1]SPO36368.1 uncharacterized protein PSFLO_01839 [Pseudozyma flocculosa]